MKKLTFKKDINRINLPFLLHDLTPWQDQVRREIEKLQKFYKVRKSARWGYEITESGAMIVVYKN